MAKEQSQENETIKTQYQPHFDYEDWLDDKKPNDKDKYIAKGFDVFASDGDFYIVRSDLDTPVFMKIDSLHDPRKKGKIYELPAAFQLGDHYFGDGGLKYVIRGNVIHCTDDLRNDATPSPLKAFGIQTEVPGSNVLMSDQPANGMHYLNHKGTFYRVGYEKAVSYTKLWEGGKKGTPFELHEKLKGGIAYFALSDYFYVIKMVDTGGGNEKLCYYKVLNLAKDPGLGYRTINESIRMFLPGGYTFDNPAKAAWETIGHFKNESEVATDYIHEFKYVHGRSKAETDTLERHWEVQFEQEIGVSVLVAKAGGSAKEKYGGSEKETTTDEWQESTEESISFQIQLEPDQTWALWQPTINLGGQKTLMAGKHVVATDGSLPTEDPWT